MSENAEYLELLKTKGIDVERTVSRFAGNEELFIKFLKKFFEETELQDLKTPLEEMNYEDGLHTAHTLKGVTGNLGMTALYELFSQMVAAIRSQDYGVLMPLFEKVEVEFNTLKSNLL